MIPGIEEKRLVNGVLQNGWPSYATLHQASVSLQDMGDRVITTQVRIDGDVVPDFSGWELYFKGERFVLPSDNPQASKDNSTRNSIVDLQFQSWVIQELKRYYFFEAASVSAGVAIADKYVTPVRLDVEGFMGMLNQVLNYYFGGKIVADLYMSGQGQYSQEPKVIDINYSYLWDIIGQIFEIYGVRNRIEYNSTTGVYTIKFGYPAPAITDHDFEYGYKGGLLKFERQVQDETITNILLGRGGEKNLPYRYFKKEDPENTEWAADPDAIPELASIYFDRLRDINFRWYVRGWMHNPNRDTSGDEAWDPGHVFPTYEISSDSPYYWAYQKGLTDTQFNPVEFVKDDASIEAYGERWGAADDNDEIYPTIQGRSRSPIGRIDEVVAVSEIITDDIAATAAEALVEKSINPLLVNYPRSNDSLPIESATFEVPTGQTGNISYAWVGPTDGTGVHIDTAQSSLVAVDTLGSEHSISGLPAGTYFLRLRLTLYVPSGQQAYGTFGMENIKLTTSAQDANAWKPTFDIWVKNIWGTTKGSSESADDYAARVWEKILGDRAGNEAKVVFSTGFMSVSEDYEFVIASYPVYDTSKTINGVPSEWRITLRKSDAEYDATGLFIPNASTGGKPIAGDKFFFTGIDMPFLYVTLGEEDLNTNKSSQLEGLSVVNPTWVISLDKVRVHTLEDGEYGRTLADRLAAGAKLRITDPRFSGGDILTLYAQSITYTWNEPSENSPYIVPDIEVVLSDKVVSRQSRADKMESSIQEIRSNYARLDDVERVVRSVAEPMFLKKTGEADSSDSPTQFASKVSSKGFRQGGVGGNGWGFYRDNTKEVAEGEEGDGDSVLEVDRVVVRKELQVNSLVVNQTEYRGGREIQSAAKIECTKVVVDDSGKYVCYFDQKQGSVKNLFVVGDFAYSTEFAPDNTVVKYYRRRVDAVDVDRIVLSDTVKDGAGVPAAGDVIIQYGHESNAARQYVIVRDVIGGGYERMISGLSTVSSNGDEYYFAGRQSGQYSNLPRWFVGAAAGEYAEYLNGQLNIKGRLQVLGESGNYSDLGYLADALPKKGATLIQGGLVLTSMIQLGQVENNAFKVYSGINGKVDETLADPTKTIAAWYGGEMLEKSAWDAMSAADKLAHQYAKTVYRFDGSGYLAGGNIHWDENGYGGIPGITWSRPSGSQNDVITIGSNVILEAGQGADQSVAALVSSVNSLQQILDWFEEVNLGTDQNPAWAVRLKKKTVGSSQLNRAFMTYGDQIVGGGTPGGGGGGAGYLYELGDVYGTTAVLRADGTEKQVGDVLQYYDSTKGWVAVPSTSIGITTDATQSVHGLMSAADKTKLDYVGFGTAGSDYVPIYLGGSTPTNVLTAHQSLAGYLPLTGGVISGSEGALKIKTTAGTAWCGFEMRDSSDNSLGYYVSRVGDGQPYWLLAGRVNAYMIWHAGNDGANSGLDADLLDGKHDGELTAQYWGCTRLDSTKNLNGVYNGIYWWSDLVDPVNSPGTNAVMLAASSARPDTMQIVYSFNADAVYLRTGHNIGGTYEGWSSWNTLYHSGNLTKSVLTGLLDASGGYYLPLTGGTLTGALALQAGIIFYDSTTYCGYLTSNSPGVLYWNDTTTWRTVYHSGNSNKSDVAWVCSTIGVGTNSPAYAADIVGDLCVNRNNHASSNTTFRVNCADNNVNIYAVDHDDNNVNIRTFLSGTERFTILNSGNVGIGTTSPSYKLDVFGGQVRVTDYTEPQYVLTKSSSSTSLTFGINSGNTGYVYCTNGTVLEWDLTYKRTSFKGEIEWARARILGTSDNWNLLNTCGLFAQQNYDRPANSYGYNEMIFNCYQSDRQDVWQFGMSVNYDQFIYRRGTYNGNFSEWRFIYDSHNANRSDVTWYCNQLISAGDQVISSDAIKKKNLVPITLTAEQIANAPAISFDWKDGHGHSFGSIAQYWKQLVPEAVLGKEGDYTLAYGQLGVVLGINNGKAIYKIEQHESEQDKEIRLLKEALGRANEKIEGLEKEVKQLRMN